MKRRELIVVGAGPAGLSAAIEAAGCGMDTVVFDENSRPGGQLFKQIHKFFGSQEHHAGSRGIQIGEHLVSDARTAGAEVILNTPVMGIFPHKELTLHTQDHITHVKADQIILATGASENAIPFPGWTLPGVIGAGAAQTMMNLHGIRPGRRVLMIGSGNVGLVVSMQLLQAGCTVVGVMDVAPRVGGYGVHAAKIVRAGVPFYLSHSLLRVEGDGRVERAVIARLDSTGKVVPGSEQVLVVDTICLAVGLSPSYQLAKMAGCTLIEEGQLGGMVPKTDEYGQTTVPGIYVSGDAAGIEEASSAMLKGRIAGAHAAYQGGYLTQAECEARCQSFLKSLSKLRQGMFSRERKGTVQTQTDEGYPLSESLLRCGYLKEQELSAFPAGNSPQAGTGFFPVIECTQNIPCNPCQTVCPKHCITVGDEISRIPQINEDAGCIGCGLCVSICSGQAIFLVNHSYQPGFGAVKIPYEFLPLPAVGEQGLGAGRNGQPICSAEVVEVQNPKRFDHTAVLTLKVPQGMESNVRFFVRPSGDGAEEEE